MAFELSLKDAEDVSSVERARTKAQGKEGERLFSVMAGSLTSFYSLPLCCTLFASGLSQAVSSALNIPVHHLFL